MNLCEDNGAFLFSFWTVSFEICGLELERTVYRSLLGLFTVSDVLLSFLLCLKCSTNGLFHLAFTAILRILHRQSPRNDLMVYPLAHRPRKTPEVDLSNLLKLLP